ncbi:MAG: hypothetical protein H0T45_04750, partial [Pyrinomonadaceae bacterium]|nr:hypothetical protein [Pyrinomonadaceae bacterium]
VSPKTTDTDARLNFGASATSQRLDPTTTLCANVPNIVTIGSAVLLGILGAAHYSSC